MRAQLLLLLTLLALTPLAPGAIGEFEEDVKDAIQNFKRKDPGIEKFFERSLGYVIYPNVGKAGFIVGGAHGNGLVFEKGAYVGRSSLTQASIGFQFGGQEFSEIIFFETEKALRDFKKSRFSVSAQISAVAAAEGAAEKAKYELGVAVFVTPKSGMMVEAAVGGQKLDFVAKE